MRYTSDRKAPYTDAAVDGFRFYFAEPSYIADLYAATGESPLLCRAYQDGHISDPVPIEVIRREKIYQRNAPHIEKWLAADRAVRRIEREHSGADKLRILRAAYATPGGGVTERVRREALWVPVSIDAAWKWLARACRYWAIERGLELPTERGGGE